MPFAAQVRKQVIGKGYINPIGVVVAFHPRLFSSSGNGGGTTSQDQIKISPFWVFCDGRNLLDNPETSDSPLIDGVYTHAPQLTDHRFLMGGITTYGGGAHAGPPIGSDNNGDNSVTISSPSLPLHQHGPGTLNALAVLSGNDAGFPHTHSYLRKSYNVHAFMTPGVGATVYDAPSDTAPPSQTHNHTLTIPSAAFSGTTGDGGFINSPISVLPKYLTVKFIMRIK